MDYSRRLSFSKNKDLERADRQALFEEFWREWHPRLRVFYRSFGSLREEDGEELAGDALERAFDRAKGYRPERDFGPWLYAIARRLAFDRMRSPIVSREGSVDPRGFDREADARLKGPAEELIAKEEGAFIKRFLEGLPEKERELTFLVYAEDMKLADVARVTETSLGTVKWRMHSLREKLRRMMEAVHG